MALNLLAIIKNELGSYAPAEAIINIPAGEFFAVMAIPFAVALVMIFATCLFIKPEKVALNAPCEYTPTPWRVVVYLLLFAVAVMIVFRLFPYYVGLAVITVALLVLDVKAFMRVDYGLLLTFTAFFVFSGNLSRIEAVANFAHSLLASSPLLVGVASCQVMSNVPSAVLLSRFTIDYRSLLIAVNIGGLGTPIASLASLITLGEYRRRDPEGTGKYMRTFLIINFSYLAVLIGTGLLTLFLFGA